MKFSVLMSVYKNDKPEFFKIALKSVLHQTVQPDEIVIVFDGPVSQGIYDVVDTIKKQYSSLRVVPLKQNGGLGKALKEGMQYCRYELIARMDSDDIAVESRFEKQLQCFKQISDLDLVGGYIEEFEENLNIISGRRIVPETMPEIVEYMKRRCPFNHMTVMFRRDSVLKAGGYLDWHYNEDYYLWIRMFLQGAIFYNLPSVLVHVRVDSKTYQRRGGWQYFVSEYGLQRYMRNYRIISRGLFLYNILIRFIVQMILPNRIRAYIFKKFARS